MKLLTQVHNELNINACRKKWKLLMQDKSVGYKTELLKTEIIQLIYHYTFSLDAEFSLKKWKVSFMDVSKIGYKSLLVYPIITKNRSILSLNKITKTYPCLTSELKFRLFKS